MRLMQLKKITISIKTCGKIKQGGGKRFDDAGKTSGPRKKPTVDRLEPTYHYYHQPGVMSLTLQQLIVRYNEEINTYRMKTQQILSTKSKIK